MTINFLEIMKAMFGTQPASGEVKAQTGEKADERLFDDNTFMAAQNQEDQVFDGAEMFNNTDSSQNADFLKGFMTGMMAFGAMMGGFFAGLMGNQNNISAEKEVDKDKPKGLKDLIDATDILVKDKVKDTAGNAEDKGVVDLFDRAEMIMESWAKTVGQKTDEKPGWKGAIAIETVYYVDKNQIVQKYVMNQDDKNRYTDRHGEIQYDKLVKDKFGV